MLSLGSSTTPFDKTKKQKKKTRITIKTEILSFTALILSVGHREQQLTCKNTTLAIPKICRVIQVRDYYLDD